jgi:predicted phosphodiesterase
MINAVNCAMENGYEAVACGHTHYPEDIVFNGIRYITQGLGPNVQYFTFR